MKRLLLGDEAIAQGAIDAGLSGVYAYPGTPSTEITEYIQHAQLSYTSSASDRSSESEIRTLPLSALCIHRNFIGTS